MKQNKQPDDVLLVEWEEEPLDLNELYEGEHAVVVEQELIHKGQQRPAKIALDYEDEDVWVQFTDTMQTAVLPLEYVRKHNRTFWELYWRHRFD